MPGAVEEAWPRRHAYVRLELEQIEALLGLPVIEATVLSGGLRNTNYRLLLKGEPGAAVLRLYTADRSACSREVALLRLVGDRVPVPCVLQSDPDANLPWLLMEWKNGARFDQMLAQASAAEVHEACRSAGEVLAAIHDFSFTGSGFLDGALLIREPLIGSWLPGVADYFASERAHVLIGADLAQEVVHLVHREGWRLDDVWGQSRLVHADYKPWNLLVCRTGSRWQISAALDWEFSFSGPPLCDLGIFLRYCERMAPEYLAGLLEGYRAGGGNMPADVRNLARLIDLISLWTFLDVAEPDPAIVRDVQPLLADTVRAFAT
jgi:fructokinase